MVSMHLSNLECLEDCWGPAIRNVLEGNSYVSLFEQLDIRIRSLDKDIEKICNLYYEGFIDSIRELIHVRSQVRNLNNEVLSLNTALRNSAGGIILKANELLKAKQVERNINIAINCLTYCLPVLECYSKLLNYVHEKRYYSALNTIDFLEKEHFRKTSAYRFTSDIKNEVPKLKSIIKKSSEEDFREFLENIRKFSPKIGEVAMRYTRGLRRRNLDKVIFECYNNEIQINENEEEDLIVQDLIDFSPIYRSLHIFTVLNDKHSFIIDYRKQRCDQAKLVLQAPPAMHDNLDIYKHYIYSILGFFIVEDHLKNTVKDVVTKSYLDDLWSISLSRAINVISMNSSSCTDPNILLRIKNILILSTFTLKAYGYPVNQIWEVLIEMRDHYNEVLLQRWVNVFREILDNNKFMPLEVESQEDVEQIVEKFPFQFENFNTKDFPKKLPFSSMVPEVYHQTKEFMYACMKFSEELSISPDEVSVMVRRAANLLLSKSFSGCLSAIFQNPNLALMQVTQIIIDTQYLENAGPFLDEFVCRMTKTQPTIRQVSATMFQAARGEAEMQVSIKLCLKLDEFFGELERYDWLLAEPIGHASPFITDMIAFLKTTFQSFSSLLPHVAQNAFKKACEHISSHIHRLLVSDEIKQISSGALQQISLDLMQCEFFAYTEPVPGLIECDVSKCFAEVRQLLDLLILEEWSTYLHDYGKVENRYKLVKPGDIIIVLEKIRETDRKNMFSVLKKSERDKKKLWDTVIRQLKQLSEHQA